MSTRQIILDTETTGLSPQEGHRIIEIGCIELIDRQLTKRHYQTYLNPGRAVDEGAFRVHGLSTEFLIDKPRFSDVVGEFMAFIQDSELIIHNAPFDVGFIQAELNRLNWPKTLSDCVTVFDTLVYARQKHRGARNNLDALCKRYRVDNTKRHYHGALLDAEILAEVYLAMTGGQIELFPSATKRMLEEQNDTTNKKKRLQALAPVLYATDEEIKTHEAFQALFIDKQE